MGSFRIILTLCNPTPLVPVTLRSANMRIGNSTFYSHHLLWFRGIPVSPAIMIVLFNSFSLHSLSCHIHLRRQRVPDRCSSCIKCPIEEEGPDIKAKVHGTYSHEVSVSSFVCRIFELTFCK